MKNQIISLLFNLKTRTALTPSVLVGVIVFLFTFCRSKEVLDVAGKPPPQQDKLARHIYENFTLPYGISIRYNYGHNNYNNEQDRSTPPREEKIMPFLNFLKRYWIDTFHHTQGGEDYLKRYAPVEIYLYGTALRNPYGQKVALAEAEGGVNITFFNINTFSTKLKRGYAGVAFHEHAHIHHQLLDYPEGWGKITPKYEGYDPKYSIPHAISKGFVSSYASSEIQEDFADTFQYFITQEDFSTRYLTPEVCKKGRDSIECEKRNAGRVLIAKKVQMMKQQYQSVGIDLEELKKVLHQKLAEKD